MEESDILHFKTNVQLKSIIGKDLINDDNIAILELVKNSFDANANRVNVKYLNLKDNDDASLATNTFTDNTSRLIIQDDGIGMNKAAIEDKWLNIAYSEKKTNTKQHNRRMAGAKGVGRFSCDRLGEYLNLYAKTEADTRYIKLSINWKLFEVEDEKKEIQAIPLRYEYLSDADMHSLGFTPFSNGVLLEIIKLRSAWVSKDQKKGGVKWNVSKLTDLKKYLEKLINPNQAFEINDFGIFIEAPEFIEQNRELNRYDQFLGKIENGIFDKLDFKTTSIETNTFDGGANIYTILKDKGEVVFWIKERNPFSPFVKDVKISIYFLNPYAKAFFTRQTGLQPVNYGSIFLFINGFRIPPYGDSGNDWLGLDQRKAQGTRRYLGSRDIVGQIEILDEKNDFQIISSREGIVNNDSFRNLTRSEQNNSYFYKALRRLERYVVEGLNWDSTIYDGQDTEDARKFKEIEDKIVAGESTDSDLRYREDDKTKRRRIYESIHSIISAKYDEVIELYINERLISDKIEEERSISEREFEQLILDFENKKIDAETLNKILIRKSQQNAEIDKQLREFYRYSTIDEATLKAIMELESLKKTNENQTSLIQHLQQELKKLKEEKEQAEKIAKTAKEETIKIKKELAETQSQNLFLKSVKSQDFNDIVNLMHQIGISVGTIQNYTKGVIFRLDQNIHIDPDELKDVFSKLNHELNKIHSISKFATKANFKIETKDTTLNVINFIEEYLLNIAKPFLPGKIILIVYEHGAKEFLLSFKPIELIIILDNLVSNAKKSLSWKERESHDSSFEPRIEISMEIIDGDLYVSFRDNGVGIPKENRDKIFDYGYTTTDGSGLGLTHVRELMKKMNGNIVLNPIFDAGAEFVLTFKKQLYE